MKLIEEFEAYRADIDVLLIDTGTGISGNVAFFCISSQETIVVTSPEPTALTDAYALIKVLSTRYQEKNFTVLVNSARNAEDAFEGFRRLSLAAEKFLNISLDYLGFIPYDEAIPKAVRMQKAFLDAYPNCRASNNLRFIASRIMEGERNTKLKGTLQFFLGNMFREETMAHSS